MIGIFEMLIAFMLIVVVLVSSGFRVYFRRRFDPSEHIATLDAAIQRQNNAKMRLHNVQQK